MLSAVEIYVEVNRLLNAGSYDAIYELMHPDHRQHINGVLAADGRDASRAADEAFYAMLPGVQRIVHDVFGTDDRAVCRSTFVGTTTDGRIVELPVAGVLYASNALIVESWLYLEPSALI